MFFLQRAKNWAKSSVSDDKKELEIYQLFQNQFSSIENTKNQYIQELGSEDRRLFVPYNNDMISLNALEILKSSLLMNKKMSIQERMEQSYYLERLYREQLHRIEDKIITMSFNARDNVYLIKIYNDIEIINSLLKEYSYMLAIQKSGVSHIDNNGELNAAEKLRVLKDNIEIRIAEIQSRLYLEEMRKH